MFMTSDEKYGISPIPDRILSVTYKYYRTHSDLSEYTDVPLLPVRFHDTIVNRAKYLHIYDESKRCRNTTSREKDFLTGIKECVSSFSTERTICIQEDFDHQEDFES